MVERSDMRRVAGSRWAMPLLALAHERRGLRFAEAVRSLGLTRSVARQTLDDLVAAGWIVRNPGHGHPLRPDYLLTARGEPLAGWCAVVMAERRALALRAGDLTRWTLPAIERIAAGCERFSELAAALAPVTPRALSLTLKAGLAHDLVSRRLEPSFPPVPLYSLTRRGVRLARALEA